MQQISNSIQRFDNICSSKQQQQESMQPNAKHDHKSKRRATQTHSHGVCYNNQHDTALCQLTLNLHHAEAFLLTRVGAGEEGGGG